MTVKLSLGEVVTDATVPATIGLWMITTLPAVTASVPVEVPYTTTSSLMATSEKVGEVTPRSV
jgi:hypothetical protein